MDLAIEGGGGLLSPFWLGACAGRCGATGSWAPGCSELGTGLEGSLEGHAGLSPTRAGRIVWCFFFGTVCDNRVVFPTRVSSRVKPVPS